MEQLRWYVVNLKKEDNLFIYFSGHGLKDNVLNNAYWLPSDVGNDGRNIKDLNERINKSKLKISNHAIKDIMRECKANHIFVVADSCFSAQLFRESTESKEPKMPPGKYFDRKSRQLFASGRELVGDGVFGKYFIGFLKRNKATYIMASDLISEVKRDVIAESSLAPEGRAVDNTGDNFGEFFLFSKNNVLVEQVETDFNEIKKTVHGKKGSLNERIKGCDGFLEKYRDTWHNGYKLDLKKIKDRYLEIAKFKSELLDERHLRNVDINQYLDRGDKASREGKYDIAKTYYEKILVKRPNDPLAKARIEKCKDSNINYAWRGRLCS